MDQKRSEGKPLHIRVTDAERQSFTEAAEARGLSLSAWVRSTLLDAARKEARRSAR